MLMPIPSNQYDPFILHPNTLQNQVTNPLSCDALLCTNTVHSFASNPSVLQISYISCEFRWTWAVLATQALKTIHHSQNTRPRALPCYRNSLGFHDDAGGAMTCVIC
jgi:hypothetical protein